MAIIEKHRKDAVVLVPDTDITWRTQPELKDVLDDLSGSGQRHIIIDLTNVREISGYGLGLLASRCARLRRRRGDIKLLHASQGVRRLLRLTQLDGLFEQFDDDDTAARSFSIVDRGGPDDEAED